MVRWKAGPFLTRKLKTKFSQRVAAAAPIGLGIAIGLILITLVLTTARGVAPRQNFRPLAIGFSGVALGLIIDMLFVSPRTSAGITVIMMLLPMALIFYGLRSAVVRLAENELIRVVFSTAYTYRSCTGLNTCGITNPTPAAALGAGGAIMLAAFRKLKDEHKSPKIIIGSAFALVIMLLVGMNFDLRVRQDSVSLESWVAFLVAQTAYLYALFGLLYACWTLFRSGVLSPVVRETAKVTSMVFTIFDWLAVAQPRGDQLWRRTLYPRLPEKL